MYSNWRFLSKHGADPYINMLAAGVGQPVTQDLDYENSTGPIVLRGIMKHKIMKQCWQDQRPFVYVDTGYFGNQVSPRNPQAHKIWHRMVVNDLQHQDIVPRPPDRWQRFGWKIPRRRHGSKVIVALPDEKPCRFYGIDPEIWQSEVLHEIRQCTERPVIMRSRQRSRQDRMVNRPLSAELENAHVLVTFNSLAAIESLMQGVPAIVLAPTHAAAPVSGRSLDTVEDPWWPSDDLLYQWLCHLAYAQFHVSEMASGTALDIIRSQL
jgi:hypothetical protein